MANKPIPTPLTADLPTNWTRGQIVAPTGQEVGLSTNYGYNYLMAKVNEARTAINTINDAFTNLPDANTLAQYLKLTGGTMTGNITMSGGAKVTGLPTPTETGDAVPKNYVDQQLSQGLAQYLKLTGGTMTGNIIMSGGSTVTGIADPVNDNDAVPKKYLEKTIAEKSKWMELERITTSQLWTVPDGVYLIGVFILGAGSSGEGNTYASEGGPSGYVKNVIIPVTPGQEFTVIIGRGGQPYNSTISPGGDTSFGNYIAKGGGNDTTIWDEYAEYSGAQPSCTGTDNGSGFALDFARSGADGILMTKLGAVPIVSSASQRMNAFDPTMVICAAGASATYQSNNGRVNAQDPAPETDLGKGGALPTGTFNPENLQTADATGYGNGGGGIPYPSSYGTSGKGGAGSPGIVIIYA